MTEYELRHGWYGSRAGIAGSAMQQNVYSTWSLSDLLAHQQTAAAMPQNQIGALSSRAGGLNNVCGTPITAGFSFKKDKDENKEEKKSVFKAVGEDFKSFMKENKSVIYWIGFLLILDHYIFEDAFREKLKGLVHRMIGKVEDTLALPEVKK